MNPKQKKNPTWKQILNCIIYENKLTVLQSGFWDKMLKQNKQKERKFYTEGLVVKKFVYTFCCG